MPNFCLFRFSFDSQFLFFSFQLIDIFGSLLERPLIKADFDQNYPKLVAAMNDMLCDAKEIYDHHMAIKNEQGKMPIHKNLSKVSGSLKWAQELRDRLTTPMGSFNHVEHPYVRLLMYSPVLTLYVLNF